MNKKDLKALQKFVDEGVEGALQGIIKGQQKRIRQLEKQLATAKKELELVSIIRKQTKGAG